MNAAILLSGGTGTRIGASIPKQYVSVGAHMMVTYALLPLLTCGFTDAVCLVAEEEWREKILADVGTTGIDITKIRAFALPGTNRQTSIWNGMQALLHTAGEKGDVSALKEEDTVLIHDAARPFLSVDLLNACYAALPGHDGVMPALPMKDTVYLSEDGKAVSSLLERSKIFAGQAPELFRFAPYYRANLALLPDRILGVSGATEPAILYGMDVVMIAGEESNFKVTTTADLERFRQIKETKDAGLGAERDRKD